MFANIMNPSIWPISCEPLSVPPDDILCYGSEDDDPLEVRLATQKRREAIGCRILQGRTLPFWLSTSLHGPLENGWVNPWASESRNSRANPFGRSAEPSGFVEDSAKKRHTDYVSTAQRPVPDASPTPMRHWPRSSAESRQGDPDNSHFPEHISSASRPAEYFSNLGRAKPALPQGNLPDFFNAERLHRMSTTERSVSNKNPTPMKPWPRYNAEPRQGSLDDSNYSKPILEAPHATEYFSNLGRAEPAQQQDNLPDILKARVRRITTAKPSVSNKSSTPMSLWPRYNAEPPRGNLADSYRSGYVLQASRGAVNLTNLDRGEPALPQGNLHDLNTSLLNSGAPVLTEPSTAGSYSSSSSSACYGGDPFALPASRPGRESPFDQLDKLAKLERLAKQAAEIMAAQKMAAEKQATEKQARHPSAQGSESGSAPNNEQESPSRPAKRRRREYTIHSPYLSSPCGSMASIPTDQSSPCGSVASTPEDPTSPYGPVASSPEDHPSPRRSVELTAEHYVSPTSPCGSVASTPKDHPSPGRSVEFTAEHYVSPTSPCGSYKSPTPEETSPCLSMESPPAQKQRPSPFLSMESPPAQKQRPSPILSGYVSPVLSRIPPDFYSVQSSSASLLPSFSAISNGTLTQFNQQDGQNRVRSFPTPENWTLESALEDAGKFLGSWDVEAEARKQGEAAAAAASASASAEASVRMKREGNGSTGSGRKRRIWED